ncbi:hypothetical protein [Paraburkholderia sp.]|uniref:hypothetical protein n=1 Tax=Paraburkholderia sp. TaxID=1926495 RepID=UPI003D6F48B8
MHDEHACTATRPAARSRLPRATGRAWIACAGLALMLCAGAVRAADGWTLEINDGNTPTSHKLSGKKVRGCELKIGAQSFKEANGFNGTFNDTDAFYTNCTADDATLNVGTTLAPGLLNINVPAWKYLFNVPALTVGNVVSLQNQTILSARNDLWPAWTHDSRQLIDNVLKKGFVVTEKTLAKDTTLYHGTTTQGAEAIWKNGVSVTASDTELGTAFYTTTSSALATEYAGPGGVVLSTKTVKPLCVIHLYDKIKNDVAGFVMNRPVDSLRRLLTWSGKDCVLSRGMITGPGGVATGTEYAFWTVPQLAFIGPMKR